MIRLVASDLDGTIIGQDNAICETNLKAMKDIYKKNINFAICTGKTYPIIKKVCSQFDATYGIFGNGSHIVNLKTGEEIYKNLLSPKDVSICISIAKKHQLHIHLYTNDKIITEKLAYMDLRNYKLKESKYYDNNLQFEIVPNIETYLQSNDIPVFKVVISNEHDLSFIKEEINSQTNLSICTIQKYGEYKDKIINKEYQYLDIVPLNSNKNEALKVLCEHLKIDQQDIMAIGDNYNDLDMIKESGIGIAVANAYDEVKQVSSYTTTASAENGGFAEAVYKFIEF